MWQDINFTGALYYYYYPAYPVNAYDYVGSYANDQASSYQNDTNNSVHVYQSYPPHGDGNACLPAGYYFSDLTRSFYPYPSGAEMNDTISAFDLQTFNTC